MPVPAEQVATLRAYLAGDFEEYERLYEQLDRDAARATYLALIEAACFEAIDRRFAGKDTTIADVIHFVADARARFDEVRDELDPRVAERIIRAVLDDDPIDDLDDKTRISNISVLLTVLIADENLDDAGLDEFLADAMKWLE